jgi:hypothetical protein
MEDSHWFNAVGNRGAADEPAGSGPQMLAADPAQGSANSHPTDAWSISSDSDDFRILDGDRLS